MNIHNRSIDPARLFHLFDVNFRFGGSEHNTPTLKVTTTVASVLDDVVMDLREKGTQVTIDPYKYLSLDPIDEIRIDFGGMCFADEEITEHTIEGVKISYFKDMAGSVGDLLEKALAKEKYKDKPYVFLFFWFYAAALLEASSRNYLNSRKRKHEIHTRRRKVAQAVPAHNESCS